MGIALPQLAPASTDRVSGGLVIDGTLRFDDTKKNYLSQTIGNGTNGFTISCWMKPCQTGNRDEIFDTVASTGFYLYRHTDGSIRINNNSAALFTSNGLYRDTTAFYNIVFSYKPVAGSTGYGLLYVNGRLDKGELFTTQLYAGTAKISSEASNDPANYYLGQWYLVDGLQLGPEYFGYTDPLTNTWRPKKFRAEGITVNDGTDWSGNYSGGGGDPGTAFNGTNPSQNGYAHSGSGLTITFPKPLSGRIIVYGGTGGGGADTYTLSDGSSLSTDQTYASSPYFDELDFGEKEGITTLTCSPGYTLHGVSVDGVMLVDSTTQNIAFGTNGFYLPLDGNSPIGEDKSGKGNDWTPVNFGGSVELDKATGAKPILNTTSGVVARPGVFGSEVGAYYAVTVASVGGGNRYHFDGVDRPNPTLIRGATYTFDQSDSTNGGGGTHPLRFATAADAAGSSQYTDGVATNGTPGQAGAYTKITVPHNAPDTLYYYCTNHGGMGSSTIQITDETKADPYAWKCVLALANGTSDISNSINCTSTTKTVTNDGVAAVTTNSEFYGSSLQFESSNTDSLTIEHADMAMGTGDFCAELWVYNKTDKSYNAFISTRETSNGTSAGWVIATDSGADLYVHSAAAVAGGYDGDLHLPLNKWTHIAYTRSGGTHRLFMNGIASALTTTTSRNYTEDMLVVGDNGYSKDEPINAEVQDVRVYKGVAKYTSNFIPASTNPDILPDSPSGVAVKTKLTKITDGAVAFDGTGDEVNVPGHSDMAFGTGNFTIDCFVYFNSFDDTYPTVLSKLVDSTLSWIVRVKNNGKIVWYSKNGGGTNNESSSEPIVLKKWHHIAAVREGTGSNQFKVYVDGKVHLTMTDANDYNDNSPLCIGTQQAGGGNTINGFISNVRLVKGTAVYTSEFIPPFRTLTNVTNTKLLCCQSPTSATAGAVIPTGSITVAGNAAATNFNPFIADINTVRGQESGYATLNPLYPNPNGNSPTDGNLKQTTTSGNGQYNATMAIPQTGSWYWEVTKEGTNSVGMIGISNPVLSMPSHNANNVGAFSWYIAGPRKQTSGVDSNYGGSVAQGDVVGVAYNSDIRELRFYLNGVDQGVAFDDSSIGVAEYFPAFAAGSSSTTFSFSVNFGQKPFKFPPPDGFQPLTSSTARPDNVITRPDKFVKPVAYQGTGSDLSLDVGFKPDFSYFSVRGATGYIKYLFDSVRGPTKYLATSHTQGDDAEGTSASTLKSFDSNGVTIGNNGQMNENSSNNWISWHWKAGGAPTATNDNTSGAMDANSVSIDGVLQSAYTPAGSPSIYPKKMSIGTKQGFSIIQWTDQNGAQTLPHGLSQAPDFILIKDMSIVVNWSAYHSARGNAKALYFNTSANEFSTSRWNSTTPTADVFSWNDNSSTGDQIAYCWHNVSGLQKFGSFASNNSADGPFIELGFKPAILWIKSASYNGGNWLCIDSTRSPDNPADEVIRLNTNASESDSDYIDLTSNGFKVITNQTGVNASSETTIYCAWAEQPAFNLYGATSTAR